MFCQPQGNATISHFLFWDLRSNLFEDYFGSGLHYCLQSKRFHFSSGSENLTCSPCCPCQRLSGDPQGKSASAWPKKRWRSILSLSASPKYTISGCQGSQQPMRLNRNTEHHWRRHACRQQLEDSVGKICSSDSEREVDTSVSLKRREDCVSIQERESCVLQQREIRVKWETSILMAPKCEARILSDPECNVSVSNS